MLETSLKNIIVDSEFKTIIENLGFQLDYLDSIESKKKLCKESINLLKFVSDNDIFTEIQKQRC